ncbi:formate-dependent nitrite reductase complex subunit [Escherichia coli]|uniref:Cytochrome c-type biogenesis protein n=1 Tax=Escherichia coli TaxID=562 RepID=A0A2X1L3K6_ECOLX|nr:formate-dependent nitrite reductase complex subunit [Escherichia coli]
MSKGLLTLLLLFTCFARAQVVDTWQFANPQQQEQALNIASQLRCPQCQNQNFTGIQCAGGSQYAPSGLQHGGGGEERSRNHWLDDRTLRRFCSL